MQLNQKFASAKLSSLGKFRVLWIVVFFKALHASTVLVMLKTKNFSDIKMFH